MISPLIAESVMKIPLFPLEQIFTSSLFVNVLIFSQQLSSKFILLKFPNATSDITRLVFCEIVLNLNIIIHF